MNRTLVFLRTFLAATGALLNGRDSAEERTDVFWEE
jgi:hypothetical protein